MLRVLCSIFLIAVLVDKAAAYNHFSGGTLSFSVRNASNGALVVDLDLITGWVLGQGPCGPRCNTNDIHRSTLASRKATIERLNDKHYFGKWTSLYKINDIIFIRDLNQAINSDMSEEVLAVNMMAKWEQDRLLVSVPLEPTNEDVWEDILFEGENWHHLTMQNQNAQWRLRAKIDSGVRSDTAKPNQSPLLLMKPVYRIELNTIGRISIAATDPDDDFVTCALTVASGAVFNADQTLPGLTLFQNCTIIINTSSALGYRNDTWGAVALAIGDHNREKIVIGEETHRTYESSYISKTTAQFLVHILADIHAPVFVRPTSDQIHHFILYTGATWVQKIYAKARENKTIDEFNVIGRQREQIIQSVAQDAEETTVKFTELKWTPTKQEVGNHIVCITATDNTGIDTVGDLCFIVDIKPDRFQHAQTATTDRPLFVDLPAIGQSVQCRIDVTCVLPLYFNSSVTMDSIIVTEHNGTEVLLGPFSKETHNGMEVYRSDLSFHPSDYGAKKICLLANDTTGMTSVETCIQSHVEQPNPCASSPCKNNADCIRSVKDPLAYACRCMSNSFTGKHCRQSKNLCEPNPCAQGVHCFSFGLKFSCWCSKDYSGERCQITIDKCTPDPCAGRGVCETNNGQATCKCFERYSGTDCVTDQCPEKPRYQLTCSPHCSCNRRGVCSAAGTCSCSVGKTGASCNTDVGNAEKVFNVTGTKFVPPSPNQASTIRCYISRPCVFSVFASTSECMVPTISIDGVSPMIARSTVGSVIEAQYIPGLQHLYTADVHVNGGTTVGTSYMCLNAEAGGSTDRLCVQISYEADPLDIPVSMESNQKNATYIFIHPTPNAESNFICTLNEDCRIILHTNLKTQCEQVVSADAGVTVFPTLQKSDSCITEVVFRFSDKKNMHVCFRAAIKSDSQTRCFNIDVFSKVNNLCAAKPCQNDGDCLLSDRNASYCICKNGYTGDYCEKGPCKPSDNHCARDAFCYSDGHRPSCICPFGMTGPLCKDRTSTDIQGSKFTDTAVPVNITCLVNRPCFFLLGLSTNPVSGGASISFEFVSPQVRKVGIATEHFLPGSVKATVSVIPLEVGQKTVCVHTHTAGVNYDKMCTQIDVTKDSGFLYGFDNRPSFIIPSLPVNADVKCQAEKPCHVLYHVTPGDGHSKACTTVVFSKKPYERGHVFTSCSKCTEGIGSRNCSFDVSFIPPATEIGKTKEVCLEVQLTRSQLKGEERCFNVTVTQHAAAESGRKNGPLETSFIGNSGVLKALTCYVSAPCTVNFHLTGPTCPKPTVSLGYINPGLIVKNQPSIVSQVGMEYTGTTSVFPTRPGTHKVCVQTEQSGTVQDEMCLNINVQANPAPILDKSKPHFINPTPASGSTILCQTGATCYTEVYFVDNAGPVPVGKMCPSIVDTSPVYTAGVHIFERTLLNSTCTATIAYVPPATASGQQKTVCTQVLFPGRKGEERCFHIDVTDNINQAVLSPCRNKTCSSGGKCMADFTPAVPTAVCVCRHGWEGAHCEKDESVPKNLPGVTNAPSTPPPSYFDVTSGIPTVISCVTNEPCNIPIPYNGIDPPVLGYVDPVLTPGTPEVVHQSAVTEITSALTGSHRLCLQTTTTGAADGKNVDEVCVIVLTLAGPAAKVNEAAPHFNPETIPGNSTVACNTNTGCHVPLYTHPIYGDCPPVSECPPGIPGVHVFDTKLSNGVCVSDVAIHTGDRAVTMDLCVSAGPGGEERFINIAVKPLTGFGPCQKLHCNYGRKCVADFTGNVPTASCIRNRA